jgi:hypothetical protein
MLFHIGAPLLGFVILILTSWQVFADLFHPTAQGSLSDWIARGIWHSFKRRRSLRVASGPLALLTVVLTWVLLLALGFTLIYWPSLPGGFRFNGPPEHGIQTAAYFSLEMLTTLGLGEIRPQSTWLRFVVTFEAMIGLGIVTACVTWIVLLYPALSRMRLLARKVTLLAAAEKNTGITPADEYVFIQLGEQVVRTQIDLTYFPIIYYFASDHRRSSLTCALPLLVNFCDEGIRKNDSERLHFAASMLHGAVEDLSRLIGDRFLRMGPASLDSVLKAFAAEN